MNKVKLQLILSGVFFALSVLILTGATVAYFSDFYQASSTITSGNVAIELTEAAVKPDKGDLVEDPDAPRLKGSADTTIRDCGVVHPGIFVFSDPTIENVGDTNAWIAAKVTVSDGMGDLQKVMGYEGIPGIDLRTLLDGGAIGMPSRIGEWNGIENVRYNDTFAVLQGVDTEKGEYYFYVFFHKTFAPGEKAVLWEQFSIPEDWSSNELKELIELSIHVQAYAVQVSNLESCYEAMMEAFPQHFKQ